MRDTYTFASIDALSSLMEKIHTCSKGNLTKINRKLLMDLPPQICFTCCDLSIPTCGLTIIRELSDVYSYFKRNSADEDLFYEEVLTLEENLDGLTRVNTPIENGNFVFINNEDYNENLIDKEPPSNAEDPLLIQCNPSSLSDDRSSKAVVEVSSSRLPKALPKIVTLSAREIENIGRNKLNKNKYPESLVCEFCGKTFRGKERAYRFFYHRNSIHTKDIKFKCSDCGKIYFGERELLSHQQLHIGPGHVCHVCGIMCARKQDLIRHLTIHQDRSYVCKYCDKKFRRKDHLTVHERIHTGNRPYLCSLCGSGYPQKKQLQLHRKRCPILKLQNESPDN